ncbi:hypothetical protein GEMRC1_012836 [Eukaryota sp. GEM-RC1]
MQKYVTIPAKDPRVVARIVSVIQGCDFVVSGFTRENGVFALVDALLAMKSNQEAGHVLLPESECSFAVTSVQSARRIASFLKKFDQYKGRLASFPHDPKSVTITEVSDKESLLAFGFELKRSNIEMNKSAVHFHNSTNTFTFPEITLNQLTCLQWMCFSIPDFLACAKIIVQSYDLLQQFECDKIASTLFNNGFQPLAGEMSLFPVPFHHSFMLPKRVENPSFYLPQTPKSGNFEGPAFEVVMIGDGGVGKTSLVEKLYTCNFSEEYIPTRGVVRRTLTFQTNGGPVNLHIRDCGRDSLFNF